MKQPNFKRKALGMMLVPLALGALPISAEPLILDRDYNGYSEFRCGNDADGNTLVFYILNDEECRLVNIDTYNSTVTVPESVAIPQEEWVYDPETGEERYETTYREMQVKEFRINNDDWYWMFNPLSNAGTLTDIILPSTITDFHYRQPDYRCPVNIHFTSDQVPSVYLEGYMFDAEGMTSHSPISVPVAALDAYKEAFGDYAYCSFVIPEGTDPKEVFDADIAALDVFKITEDPDCVPYASWSATDEDGTLFAFEYPMSDITLRGVITTAESVTVPEKVCVVNPDWYAYREVPVRRCCLDYYNEDNNGFPGSVNLTDVYFPSDLCYAEFHGEGFNSRMNFHFTGESIPDINFYDGSSSYVNLVVPDDMFYAYSDALGDYDYVLRSETPASPVTVNVATPGTLAEQILSIMDDLGNVRWLIVTGTPDELDLRAIRRLQRLEILDLSATTGITRMMGCNGLKYLHEVKLPEGITEIGESAFANCTKLSDINIPASTTVISGHAFENTRLSSVEFSNVEYIGTYAFARSHMVSADLPKVRYIEREAFENASTLKSVTFGPELEYIRDYAFNGCDLTGTLELPESLTSLGWYSFSYNRNLQKVILNKNLTDIAERAFDSCYPTTVECHILFPGTNPFRYCDLSNTTLYVPALTINEYLLHDSWIDFINIEPLPDDLTVLDIDREFTIKSDKGIADKADLNLVESHTGDDYGHYYGHLTVNRSNDLNLDEFKMGGRYDYEYYDPNYGWRYGEYYIGSTIIPESNVTAESIDLNFRLRTGRWTFLSFPFDVNVKDIVVDDDALWVVRKYSGEARAKLEENTWQNMADGTVLKAGEGYIFNCECENRSEVNFTIRPAAGGNALFANTPVEKKLESNPSEFAHNASWNLAGNSFPAYLNLKGVDFEAPVTVWDGGTYYAYSPVDDDLVLEPFQAFFVQAQDNIEGGDVITLRPEARAHSREAAAALEFASDAARAPRASAPRSLFNIYVKGENGSDRTRVVVNEEASAAYESNRDASKFMSTDDLVPQIFVNNSNVRMAINEAPLGNGEFTLGARFGKKGEYTISLDTRDAEGFTATLIDNVTGIVTDLLDADYTFDADASLNDARFTLALTSTNAVGAIAPEGLEINVDGNTLSIRCDEAVEISVAAIDGMTVASDFSADFSASLESGIYIVKAGRKTLKVKVGK